MKARLARSLVVVVLAGCSTTTPPTGLQSIQISAGLNANQNSATALDLVFVYDSSKLATLPKSGPDWFVNKAALSQGLATAIDVLSLQIPPVDSVSLPQDQAFPSRYKKAVGVYGYANYLGAAGQPVVNLTPYGKVTILLTPDSVVVNGAPPAGLLKRLFGN